MTQPVPGWYPDPEGNGQRYWDGHAWGLVAPASQPPPPTFPPTMPPPAPAPAGKARVVWIVLAVLVGAAALVGAYFVIPHGSKSQPVASTSTATASALPPPGTAVRDGKFEFLVTGIAPATWYGNPQPAGKYVMVTMQIRNIGNGPQTFFVENQRMVDDAGRQYAPAMGAMMAMRSGSATSRELNPGFGLEVQIPYDVPQGMRPAAMEFHDSMLSGGVKVGL